MTNVEILDGRRDASGGYKVDVSRGGHNDRLPSEWFSRLDDETFLSLSDLCASVTCSYFGILRRHPSCAKSRTSPGRGS